LNWVDGLIILLCFVAYFRGRDIGLVQQVFSTVGFFGGLFLGAWLEPHTVTLAHTQLGRSMVTLFTTLGCAMILLLVGEFFGAWLKHRVQKWPIDRFDRVLGSVLSVITILLTAWLSASILTSLDSPGLQSSIKNSAILSSLTRKLPPAPNVIADLGHLIDPNGFPQVFVGNEPAPRTTTASPTIAGFESAIARAQPSVVKLEGLGCGGVVEGSGFVASPGTVITNAHVVAGVKKPYIADSNGQHTAHAIWFDPNLDNAILQADNLAGSPLNITSSTVNRNTQGVVLGYPGGGPFSADAAVVLDEFTAEGRNIYNSGDVERDVYELNAHVIPGNSGGPVVDKNGTVIGVVFAESTTYNNIGYALSTPQVLSVLRQAQAQNRTVSTAGCAQ
jgi:S1-C subfamily serine protease